MQTGVADLTAQGVVASTAFIFLIGARRLRLRGRRWSRWRLAALLAGLLCIWVAVGSDLASYDGENVTAHVGQHLLLMMVAPPLLVLGRPLTLMAQAGGRRLQGRLARAAHGRTARLLTHPVVATAVYLGSMYAMFTSRTVYGFLLSSPPAHAASHAWLLLCGLLYWEALLGPPVPGRLSPPFRVASLLAAMPFEATIGLWLRYQAAPIAPVNSLAGTQRAGEAFVVGATFVSTIWLAVVVAQWAGRAIREERRTALRPPSQEWTTPWWAGVATEVKGAGGGP